MNEQPKSTEVRTARIEELTVGPYQVWRSMAKEKYDDFRQDIADNGMESDIHVDESFVILDGHHRYRAAMDNGLAFVMIKVHYGLTDEQKRGFAYRVNVLTRDISNQEKREQAERLRREGRSYRQIAEWLGISVKTARRWVSESDSSSATGAKDTVALTEGIDGKVHPSQIPQVESNSRSATEAKDTVALTEGIDGKTHPSQMLQVESDNSSATEAKDTVALTEGADGKLRPSRMPQAPEILSRAKRIQQHVDEGMSVEEAAKVEGVSRRTAFNNLKRLKTEDLTEDSQQADNNTIEPSEEEEEEEPRSMIGSGIVDPKVYEMVEYIARTAAEAPMYREDDISPNNRLLYYIHTHLCPFLTKFSFSFETFSEASDELAKSLYLEQVRLLTEVGLRVLITLDYESIEKIMEVLDDEIE